MQWSIAYERRGPTRSGLTGGGATGNTADMSLQKNVAGQNVGLTLSNAATNAPFTGASFSGAAWIAKDGVQSAFSGSFVELSPTGKALYNYAPTQAETNANSIHLWVTPSGAVPTGLLFLTSGLHKNVSGQGIAFGMMSEAGVPDPSATVTVTVWQDGGSLAAGGGTVSNLGHGQYDYPIPQAETNGANCNYSFSASGDVTVNYSIWTVP